ncbi:AI-2E family transporter [Neisseriaceae bacterium ESL0693]|nr:AI-2E family transporter [Neisseriaceae bacterium ESL0693]
MSLNTQTKLDLFCVAVFSIFFIILMQVHLMAAVITGLLTYTLVLKLDHFLSCRMQRFGHKSRLVSVLLLTSIIVVIFIGGFGYIFSYFLDLAKHPTETMENIQSVIDKVSHTLPASIGNYLPDNIDQIQATIVDYLKEHVFYLQSIVKNVFHLLIIIVVGMIIGLILGFQQKKRTKNGVAQQPALKIALEHCLDRLVLVFQYVAFSQVIIALFNAVMTLIFLFVVLPIFGIDLPFRKTLVIATFVFGLIPIIGNLVVNVIMFFIGLSISFKVAIVVTIYLIFIHKFEYVLNAKIVGGKIHAGICELLIAMLFLETLFGVIGLVFAPIFYAFLKLSLKEMKLI